VSYRYNPLITEPSHYFAETNFCSYIHPEQAKIFALFDGNRNLFQVTVEVAKRLNISREQAEKIIIPYIENEERLNVSFGGNRFTFPKNFIVPVKEKTPVFQYKENDFRCDNLDFKNNRLYTFPMDVTFMVNTICLVDCIYCYADCRKKMDCRIPLATLDKLINDCHQNNVRVFALMGGEVLKYKDWKWLVAKMVNCGFTPFISTKIPIGNDVIDELCNLGIKQFQISLDSFDGSILEKNLHIVQGERYIAKMRKTLKGIENRGIELNIHAVVTTHNKELSHLKRYLQELALYKNIKKVQLSIAAESLYKDNYSLHKLNNNETEILFAYVREVNKSRIYPFDINASSGFLKAKYVGDSESKKDVYKTRGLCSANARQVFILPNGDVTICEELMFHPQFILGNIMKQDLQTIWQNNKLKRLEDVKTYVNSRCGKCGEFANCKGPAAKGVCWKEILHAYGSDKWNYPDPKCPHAPKEMRPFYIE
jgi:radical SAM protein with 4Fe4S-binding SPASM domain